MPTRRQFIATTAAAAATASVFPAVPDTKVSKEASTDGEERRPASRRADEELKGYITRASFGQSVPFPEG